MESADQVAAELRKLRLAVAELAGGVKSSGRRQLGRAGEGIEETSQDLLRNSRRLAEDLERRLGKLEKTVSKTVREHPKAAVGGGILGVALVGLLLAMVFRRDR